MQTGAAAAQTMSWSEGLTALIVSVGLGRIEAVLYVLMFVLFAVDVSTLDDRRPRFREIVIGIGILGTFVGVLVGLQSVDLSGAGAGTLASAGTLVQLMNAMRTAFASSVLGLFLATFVQIGSVVRYDEARARQRVERARVRRNEPVEESPAQQLAEIVRLQQAGNDAAERHHAEAQETARLNLSELQQTASRHHTEQEEAALGRHADVMQAATATAEAARATVAAIGDTDSPNGLVGQIAAMRREADDHFGKIDALTETIAQELVVAIKSLTDELKTSIVDVLGHQLTEMVQRIEKALIEQFGATFIEFNKATQALNVWQQEHKKSVQEMTEHFHLTVAAIEAVETQLTQIAASCQTIPPTLKDLREAVGITDEQTKRLLESLGGFAALRESAQDALPILRRELDRIGTDLGRAAAGLDATAEQIAQAVAIAEEGAKRAAVAHRAAIDAIIEQVRKDVELTLHEQRETVERATAAYDAAALALTESAETTKQESVRALQQVAQTTQEASDKVRDLAKYAEKAVTETFSKTALAVAKACDDGVLQIRQMHAKAGNKMLVSLETTTKHAAAELEKHGVEVANTVRAAASEIESALKEQSQHALAEVKKETKTIGDHWGREMIGISQKMKEVVQSIPSPANGDGF